MKLIAGLGNPGKRYAATRHNVGFDILDLLASRHHVEWESAPRGIHALVGQYSAVSDVAVNEVGVNEVAVNEVASAFRRKILLAKPLTFMNLSGSALRDLLQFYKIDVADALIVVDDINLELGRLRARPSGSAGGHNGLKSVIETLGSEGFARLRVGVGRGDARRDLADHVLAKFEPDERSIVAETVGRAADAVELFITDGIEPVMNRFNRKEDRNTN